MIFMFENLAVYQKAVDFAERALKLADSVPKGQRALSDQLKRASLSISLNIAEGNGRWHARDRKNFFLIARGSAFECVPLLEIYQRRNWINQSIHEALKSELIGISRMLSALVNKGP